MVRYRYIKKNCSKGASIIEILLAMALLGMALPVILSALVSSREAKNQRFNRVQSVGLLREMEEAVRVVREANWDNISSNITMEINYYPSVSGNTWVLSSGTETVNTYFTRYVSFSDVYRDSSGDIVESGGTLDPSTKKATLTVSWEMPVTGSSTSTIYLTRYVDNATWNQTTDVQFDTGTYTATESINENGGEIRLTKPSEGTWNDLDQHEVYNDPGTGDGNNVFVSGDYAYLVTNSDGTNSDFTILSSSDPSNIVSVGTLDIGYDINDVHVSGDYAYLASSNTAGEFVVVDISTKSNPTVSTTLDLTGPYAANGVYVDGSYAYVAKDGTRKDAHFVVVDISTPTSPSESDTLSVTDSCEDSYVSGNYAYLACHVKDAEFIVVDISNKTNVRNVETYDTPGNSSYGLSVYVSGNYAYLTTMNSTSTELYVFDITTPTSVSLAGSYEVGSDVNDVSVYNDYVYLATSGSSDFMVLDASTISSLSLHGSLSTTAPALGLHIDVPYAYLSTAHDSEELVVLDGSGYYTSGTYESQTFDATDTVGFNYVNLGFTTSPETTLTYQVATSSSNPPTDFYGPDGTSGTSYSDSGAIPLNSVENRYFRIKFTLGGDSIETPLIEDWILNYSP